VPSCCCQMEFYHGVYVPGVDSGSVGGSPQPGSRAAAPAGTQPRAATGCCPAHAKKSARTRYRAARPPAGRAGARASQPNVNAIWVHNYYQKLGSLYRNHHRGNSKPPKATSSAYRVRTSSTRSCAESEAYMTWRSSRENVTLSSAPCPSWPSMAPTHVGLTLHLSTLLFSSTWSCINA
jgi:hypothetical protein